MYDLPNSKEVQITTDKSDQEYPRIYDTKIVWADERNGNYDICMATISEVESEPNPSVANFSSGVTSGYPALTVQFNDLSEGTPSEWYWDFGDGGYSGLQNPIHTYFEEGNYTVTLEISNPEGNNETTKIDYIQVKPASSVKLTSITLDPENSTGVTTNAPGAWTTSLEIPWLR